MWAVISSSLFRLRSCKHEKRLKVTARLTILHYFLDTVLEEESDEAAGSHNGSRPATRQGQTWRSRCTANTLAAQLKRTADATRSATTIWSSLASS